jgi:hypothetical protein
MMPRFYFHLISKESTHPPMIREGTLITYGRKLIDMILLHVGYDGAEEWKLVASSDEDDAYLIIPFAVSFLPRDEGQKVLLGPSEFQYRRRVPRRHKTGKNLLDFAVAITLCTMGTGATAELAASSVSQRSFSQRLWPRCLRLLIAYPIQYLT